MVGQNRAAIISQMGAWSTPKITEGKSIDFAGAIDAWNKGSQIKEQREKDQLEKERRNAYIDAINGGNQEEIDKAFANYDPETYAKVMMGRQDADTQFARQKELANIQFNNNMALKRLEASLKPATTAQQNMEYLIKQGYSPEEAAQLYYSGQNPNLNVMALGQKGQEAYGKETGKNYASDLDEYNNLVANYPALEEMASELKDLAKTATYTKGGALLNEFRKQTAMPTRQSAKDSAAYQAKVNQNLLPLLRQTFGAAFTEKDRESLQATLGDPFASPEEKDVVLSEFIKNKRREIESKKRKLDSYSSPSLKQFQNNEEVIDWKDFK